jgi:hypothetical protein
MLFPIIVRARPQGGRAHPLFTLRNPWPQNGIKVLFMALDLGPACPLVLRRRSYHLQSKAF